MINIVHSTNTGIVLTYHEPLFYTDSSEAALAVWFENWRSFGWRPVILGKEMACIAKDYQPLVAKVRSLSCAPHCDRHFQLTNFVRYLAFREFGGGFFVDYDEMNYGVTPYGLWTYDSRSHWLTRGMAVQGTAADYGSFVQQVLSLKSLPQDTSSGSLHTSDMGAKQALVPVIRNLHLDGTHKLHSDADLCLLEHFSSASCGTDKPWYKIGYIRQTRPFELTSEPSLTSLRRRTNFGHWLTRRGLFGKGVEVGTYMGVFADVVLTTWPGTLYCVDTWCKLSDYNDTLNNCDFDKIYLHVEALTARHDGRLVPMRMRSLDAASKFEDGSLAFVYIDADHSYSAALADMCAWWPKVKPGGVFCGHDFGDGPQDGARVLGVKSAWEAFSAGHNLPKVPYITPECSSWWVEKT